VTGADAAVIVTHDRPILAQLSQGPAVRELALRLASLGYPSTIAEGQNAHDVYDASVHGAVLKFRSDAKVKEAAPDKIEVKFGIKVSGTANWLIAKAATEGNFDITLTWTPKPATAT